ncbi:mechanosensitive ion channel family protein [Vulgatibacter sp.]|uniref:mechanosensitive ion channel family protein n=1 Tax=Vulgatibacter sp. TaxID=1971226 RepID=UPI00356AFCE0
MQRPPRTSRRPVRRQTRRTRPGRGRGASRALGTAQLSLRSFKQATIVAVAMTGLVLALLGEEAVAQPEAAAPAAEQTAAGGAGGAAGGAPIFEAVEPQAAEAREVARATGEQARGVAAGLAERFVRGLPRLLVALAALIAAWIVFRLTRLVLRRVVPGWARATALTAVVGFAVWVLAGGIAVSVIAGDIRGLLGSVGLVGLALSWALQTPIESFTGWLLNSFRGYYRVGDRIAVGETYGDVFRIDVLTTTIWEIGGRERPGPVQAEQPTGRLITIPNHEILTGSVVNYTRDFPWVWDEIAVTVANESDLPFAAEVARQAVAAEIGEAMAEPARRYADVLRQQGLEIPIATEPEVFLTPVESWTEIAVRYLVPARGRRVWKSRLTLAVLGAYRRPDYADRIFPGYPREQQQRVDAAGKPID